MIYCYQGSCDLKQIRLYEKGIFFLALTGVIAPVDFMMFYSVNTLQ